MSRPWILTAVYLTGLSLATASCATTERLMDRAGQSAEREAADRVDRSVSAGADAAEDAILPGDDGFEEPTDPAAEWTGAEPEDAAPGGTPSFVASNDFEAGDRTILLNDFTNDNVGDFPREFVLIHGSFEIAESEEGRYLMALSGGIFAIPLPETLPDQFTIESSVSMDHGNAFLRIMPGRAFYGRDRSYRGSVVSVEYGEAGIEAQGVGPRALTPHHWSVVKQNVSPLKVMADGDHMKVYLGDQRVANAPNAVFPRSDTLFVAISSSSRERPVIMGPIRIASGGADLYGTLEREGRVALDGIYFDTGSDQLRSESHATLAQVGAMLEEYPELNLSIEGHTDSQGEDGFNLELSDKRAASVRRYLIGEFGIDAERLSSRGLGESRPVASNETPEGRQQNRRVELVRMP